MRSNRLTFKIIALLLACLTLLPLASCGPKTPEATTRTEATTAEEPAKYTVRLNTPASTAIHTELQASYLADKDPFSIKSYMRPAYAAKSVNYDDEPGTIEFGYPAAITLTWDVETELSESDVRAYKIRIWRASDARSAVTASLPVSIKKYDLQNAMIGETYCWTVTAFDGDGKAYVSDVARFTTEEQGPRNLYVDGVFNVRDLGGWKTKDGGRIRQGLLYRGARIVENSNAAKLLITEKGIKTMRDELGIKSEIDLRLKSKLGGLTASVLGSTVNFYSCPMSDDSNLMFSDPDNLQNVCDVFALLADESNYPVFFHCSAGLDRTGLIAWLVNGLCGVAEDDLWRDYLFSNFARTKHSRSTGIKSVYVDKLKSADGKTFADQIYNYLKDTVGVPAADLDAVIRIMKEPAAK